MYISVFFGLIPTSKENVVRMQCIVSYRVDTNIAHTVYNHTRTSRSMCGCTALDIFLCMGQYWLRCGESIKFFTALPPTNQYVSQHIIMIPHNVCMYAILFFKECNFNRRFY